MSSTHDRGYYGEQTAAFALGERGYMIVYGPSGAAGHKANASGFDGVAYNPKSQHLIVYDNKAFKRSGNASGASALTTNLKQNLAAMVARVQAIPDLPFKNQIVQRLQVANAAVQNGTKIPNHSVELVVTGTGGNVSGVTERLQRQGVKFLSLDTLSESQASKRPSSASPVIKTAGRAAMLKAEVSTPRGIVSPRSVIRMQRRVARLGAAAEALQKISGWLNDLSLKVAIEREMKSPLFRDAYWAALLNGDGVLIIISIEETRHEAGVTRRLLGIYTQSGRDETDAKRRWLNTPRITQGPAGKPPFSQIRDEYQWVAPLVK